LEVAGEAARLLCLLLLQFVDAARATKQQLDLLPECADAIWPAVRGRLLLDLPLSLRTSDRTLERFVINER
jgi:hypothetical protein